MSIYRFAMLFFAAILTFALAGCGDDAEAAEDNIENAAQETGDAIEEGVEETGDAVENATD
jgi:uncharacterized lipoprotein YehR (DUF1307 family)